MKPLSLPTGEPRLAWRPRQQRRSVTCIHYIIIIIVSGPVQIEERILGKDSPKPCCKVLATGSPRTTIIIYCLNCSALLFVEIVHKCASN